MAIFKVINKGASDASNETKCLNIKGDTLYRLSNSIDVTLWSDTGSNEQKWEIDESASSTSISSVIDGRFGLNIYRSGSPYNCNIYMISGNETDSTFILEETSNNYYKIKWISGSSIYYLSVGGYTNGLSVYWSPNFSNDYQLWKLERIDTVSVAIPATRKCNWNQFYSNIVNAINSKQGCSITSALDVANIFGGKNGESYTINDLSAHWINGYGSWYLPSTCKGRIASDYTTSFTIANIKSEIDAGRPVIVRFVSTSTSGNHFVVAYGYFNDGSTEHDIRVFDPATESSNTSKDLGRNTTLYAARRHSSMTKMNALRYTEFID